MQIKRYTGEDVQDVMLKVRNDLGPDAIIINTRKVKRQGLLNLFSKPLIEILAAIDKKEQPSITQNKKKGKKSTTKYEQTYSDTKIKETHNDNKEEKYTNQMEALDKKTKEIENLLGKIYSKMQEEDITNLNIDQEPKYTSTIIRGFSRRLLENNVEVNIVKNVISQVMDGVTNETNINEITGRLQKYIINQLGKPEPIKTGETEGRARIIAFVGPTGVGKTTTLAKIAAIYSINHQKDIGIISADTYRIAAVEQLKTYAEILGLPVNVVYSPEEIPDAIKKFQDKDLILIDTAGRSHKNKDQFNELKKAIDISKPDEVFLLISITTNYNVIKEIIKSYEFLKNYKIILTKIDEINSWGMVLNISQLTNKRFSYITTGQSVPDDIEVIDTEKVAKMLMETIKL